MLTFSRKASGILFPIIAAVAPLALYIKTLAPTYIPIDSAEFALCFHYWGICHPPGFPLFIIIGKIFTTVIPFGSLIFKANLLSAVFGALTILFIFLTLKILKISPVIALLLALFTAVSGIFWEYSVAVDVFTFATFQMVLAFYLLFKNKTYWAFFVLGLLSSHFYLSAVLLPVFIYHVYPSKRKKEYILALLIFALGFFPQVFMYIRMQQDPFINWGHHLGLLGFIDFIRRKEFGSIFLLANPVLKFSLLNYLNHIKLFAQTTFVSLGVILPLIFSVSLLRLYKNKIYLTLAVSFLAVIVVQLFLLSTIDPTGEDSPFQISKFYLVSYVPLILASGLALDWLNHKFFEKDSTYAAIFLGLIILIFTSANFRIHNNSHNYFSQNLVLDALGQLPENSIAITVDHTIFFGGLYEQNINKRFSGVDLLYFPNEKNRDTEKYQPQLFKNPLNQQFMELVKDERNLGFAEDYILQNISRNLNRPIFILQGSFEEKFFGYLKPYIKPYGLWWKIEQNPQKTELTGFDNLFANLKNFDIKKTDLHQKQQQHEALVYAVSLHSTAIELAATGNYDKALGFLKRSLDVDPNAENVNDEINLIKRTESLENQKGSLVKQNDIDLLNELGNNYFTLRNYRECKKIFEEVIFLNPKDARSFNNLASCQILLGEKDAARINYQRALEIDPKLELAKKGLDALRD